MTTPRYIDYMFPPQLADAYRTAPLVHVATPAELQATTVTDPVFGDPTTCLELQQRDQDCWTALAATYPPQYSYALSPAERQQAAAARAVCRRRAAPLLQVCRVSGVRVG